MNREPSSAIETGVSLAAMSLILIAIIVTVAEKSRQDTAAAVLPAAVEALANADRSANGLPPLSPSPLLAQAAQMKAQDMAAKSYFAHVSPDGKTPLDWLNAAGYRYQNVGENLGLNYASSESVESGWMNSPEHRANILLPQFTEIGVGYAEGNYEGYSATFTVELLATPLPPNTAPKKTVSAPSAPQAPAVVKSPESGSSQRPATPPVPAAYSTAIVSASPPGASVASLEALIATLLAQIDALTKQLRAAEGK